MQKIILKIKRSISSKIETVRSSFYFRPGRYFPLTIGVWCLYLIISAAMMFLSIRSFYKFFLMGDDYCFAYIGWFFVFYCIWKLSLKIYPAIWDDPGPTLLRKMLFSGFVAAGYIAGLVGYSLTDDLLDLVPAGMKPLDLLVFLNNPFVLCVLGGIFLWLWKLKRFGLAAGLWGIVGFYHAFSLLPDRTGQYLRDLDTLRGTGEQSWPVLTFLGANVIVLFGIFYLCFIKSE
jgi:hypothetical protein